MTLFAHRTAAAANIGRRHRNDTKGRRTLEQFADRLAEHGDIGRAAEELGRHPAYGRSLFQRMRRELGWQAR